MTQRYPSTPQVARAVDHINRLFVSRTLETALLIGSYVLREFFEGDPDRLVDEGKTHPSFRSLAGRDDLACSSTYLWRAAQVVAQARLLSEDITLQLSFSHHVALLPLTEDRDKRDLASLALDRQWSVRALAAEVESTLKRRGRRRPGRPRKPGLLRGMEAARRGLQSVLELEAELAEAALDASLRERLLREVEGQRAALAMLHARLVRAHGEE